MGLRDLLKMDLTDERTVKRIILSTIKNLSRAEAMEAMWDMQQFVDRMAGETFGPRSWDEYKRSRQGDSK